MTNDVIELSLQSFCAPLKYAHLKIGYFSSTLHARSNSCAQRIILRDSRDIPWCGGENYLFTVSVMLTSKIKTWLQEKRLTHVLASSPKNQ